MHIHTPYFPLLLQSRCFGKPGSALLGAVFSWVCEFLLTLTLSSTVLPVIKKTDNSWIYETPGTVLITVCGLAHLDITAIVTTVIGVTIPIPILQIRKLRQRMHTADPQFEPWFQRPHP